MKINRTTNSNTELMSQSKRSLYIFAISSNTILKLVDQDHLVLLSYSQDMIRITNFNFTQPIPQAIMLDGKALLSEVIMLLPTLSLNKNIKKI